MEKPQARRDEPPIETGIQAESLARKLIDMAWDYAMDWDYEREAGSDSNESTQLLAINTLGATAAALLQSAAAFEASQK